MAEPTKLTPLSPDEVRSRAIQFLTARKVAIAGGTDLITGSVSWSKGGCLVPLIVIVIAWSISGFLTLITIGVAGLITGPIALLVTVVAIAKGLRTNSGVDTVSVQIARIDGGTMVTASGGGRSGPSIARDFLRSLPGMGGAPDTVQAWPTDSVSTAAVSLSSSAYAIAVSPASVMPSATGPRTEGTASETRADDSSDPFLVASLPTVGPSESPTGPALGEPAQTGWSAASLVSKTHAGFDVSEAVTAVGAITRRAAVSLSAAGNVGAARFRAFDRRAQLSLILIPVIALIGLFVVSSLNSPESQLKTIVETVVQREYPKNLNEATGFAHRMGVLSAPASVSFAIDDWSVSGAGSASWKATWTLVARDGSGARTATKAFTATFTKLSAAFGSSLVGDPIDVSQLLAPLTTDDEVQRLLTATNQANAPFAIVAQLETRADPDPSAPRPDPVEQADETVLKGEKFPVASKGGTEPTLQDTYLVVDGKEYLVRQVPVAGTPATLLVGTLDPDILTADAATALKAFADAKLSHDLAGALTHLSNADGLVASGLDAGTIEAFPASQLSIRGSKGDYTVVTPDGIELARGTNAKWSIDYTGQPLVNFTFDQKFYYADSTLGSPVTITLRPVSIMAGATDSTVDFVFDVKRGEGGRTYNDRVTVLTLALNGQSVDQVSQTQICGLSPAEGDTSKTCELKGVPIPAGGLQSIKLSLGFGPNWALDQWGSTVFSASSGGAPSDVGQSAARGITLTSTDRLTYAGKKNVSEPAGTAPSPFVLSALPVTLVPGATSGTLTFQLDITPGGHRYTGSAIRVSRVMVDGLKVPVNPEDLRLYGTASAMWTVSVPVGADVRSILVDVRFLGANEDGTVDPKNVVAQETFVFSSGAASG